MRTGSVWPLDPAVTFLTHGTFGSCPAPVLEAQRAWRARLEAAPIQFLDYDLPGYLAAARERIGAFVNADPDGLAFVPNTTTGVSTVLRSLRFEPGDELLITDHEYNATVNALRLAAETWGARIVVARIPFPIDGPEAVVDTIVAAVTSRTRLALISHVTSPTALVFPIETIVAELAQRGVDTLVDGAHAVGMVPIDVDRMAPAYWTGNGHKWLCGPKGSAVLWAREDRRAAIRPLVVSHGANDPRADSGEEPRFRLEFDWPGTVDPTPYLAMADAIDLVGGLEPGGWPAIMAANHALVLEGRDLLAAALGVAPPAPDAMLGAMASLPLPVTDPSDELAAALMSTLRDDGFVVPVAPWPVRAIRPAGAPPERLLLRLSAQRYNERSDYEHLAEVVPG